MKKCKKCKVEKSLDDFYIKTKAKDRRTTDCKSCIKQYNFMYARSEKGIAYRKKISISGIKSEHDKKYRNSEKGKAQRSSEKYKEAKREWNSLYGTEYRRNYMKKKYANDTNHKLSVLLRSRMHRLVKFGYCDGSPIRDMGCTLNELRKHLEKMFKDGMTWENHGLHGWHIDHIKPLSKFNLSDRKQFLEANNFKNLQPLWATENRVKGNR